MNNVLEVNKLTKKYKKFTAVDNLSFSLKEGEILGLLGPNGSGKTTTINCILSLLNYDGGTIKVFNKEMKPDTYSSKSKVGVIFQDISLFNELNVNEKVYMLNRDKSVVFPDPLRPSRMTKPLLGKDTDKS